MPNDPQHWDARYRSEKHRAETEPAPLLCELLPFLVRGRALDLAMGGGRNAVFLAANGWHVTGVDSSRIALENAAALAEARGLPVLWVSSSEYRESRASLQAPSKELTQKLPGLWLLQVDLEHSTLPAGQFELVICFNYLQRSLFSAIEAALRPGGMLVYETYTLDQLAFPKGPRNPDHLLRPEELRRAFPSLETLFYRELCAGKGIASLLARRPARSL